MNNTSSINTNLPTPTTAGPAAQKAEAQGRSKANSRKLTPPSPSIGLLKMIAEDWRTHSKTLTKAGLQTLVIHRFGKWASQQRRPVWLLLSIIYRPAYWFVRNCYGIELPHSTVVGRRVLIAHQSGIVIHHNAVIGDDCLIRQNCTIGGATHETADAAPALGKGVHLGAGSVLLGRIEIGDNARIGPNAVVMTSIPSGATVFAPAPRVIHPPRPREQFSDQGDTLHKTRKAGKASAAAALAVAHASTSPQQQPAAPSQASSSSSSQEATSQEVTSLAANQSPVDACSQSQLSDEDKSAMLHQGNHAGKSGCEANRLDEANAVSSGRSQGDDR